MLPTVIRIVCQASPNFGIKYLLLQRQGIRINTLSNFCVFNTTKTRETYMQTYIHTYTDTYIRTHTYSHACIHTYIHTQVHIHTQTHIHTSVRTYVHAYIKAGRQASRQTKNPPRSPQEAPQEAPRGLHYREGTRLLLRAGVMSIYIFVLCIAIAVHRCIACVQCP